MKNVTQQQKFKLYIFFVIVCFMSVILLLRLSKFQVIESDKYKKMALDNQTRNISIKASRGDILDRNGMKLAFNIQTYDVWVRPSELKSLDDAVEKLSDILEMDADVLKNKIENANTILVKVAEDIDKSMADPIDNIGMPGIWKDVSTKRIYPYGEFASRIIGKTSKDGHGISGVELKFNNLLEGVDGQLITATDVSGRQLYFSDEKKYNPDHGLDVILTIDEIVQHFLEVGLQNGIEKTQSKSAMGIVMDIKTGEILGMATKPSFNLQNPSEIVDGEVKTNLSVNELEKLWRNPVVSDLYEPGSTFKLITSAIALEENLSTPYKIYNSKGYVDVDGVRIKSWRYRNPFGKQTLTQALENSDNPVFIQIGMDIGKHLFYQYLDSFNLLGKTGVDMPAEARSLYQPEEKCKPVELATMSFGHGISITPLQLISAVSAIANDGKYMQPHIVKGFKNENNEMIKEVEPKLVRQIVSPKTSKEVRLMMESVIENGSGKDAYIPGIRVGGKTGTTEKIVNGEYSGDHVYASFIGIAPVDDPQVAILVVVDEPQSSQYGSVVAAPIFKDIAEGTLRYLGVKPKINSSVKKISLPDFDGLTYEKAQKLAKENNLVLSISVTNEMTDEHVVTKQFPPKHSKVNQESIVILYFDN